MFDTFVENLDTNNVDVVTFDVYANQCLISVKRYLKHLATFTRTRINQEEQELMTVRQDVMNKFAAADSIVFAFPMWNLTIPAALHTFIDYIFQAGVTFSYNEDGSMNQCWKDKESFY